MVDLVKFHDAVCQGDFGNAKSLLSIDMTLINGANEDGLLPLHQACFRGHVELVDFLLKNGADVNAPDRKQGYTALMFAAINGNLDLVELLLHHDARPDDTNKVNRTAAQMAAFVGNHHASTLIENFFDRSEIDQFIGPNVSPSRRLEACAANALYRLLIGLNITPVKALLCLNNDGAKYAESSVITANCLLNQWRQAVKVLHNLLENYFTPHRTHEALALKFHVLACLLQRAGEFMERNSSDETVNANDNENLSLNELIREFLQGGKPHGLPLGQEKFIRQALLSFPHQESTLWRHLVTRVAKVQPGYSPTALSSLEAAINGRGAFVVSQSDSPSEYCATCGDRGRGTQIKLCRNCHETGYCSVTCQRLHWFTHKKFCSILKAHHDKCENSRKVALESS